MAKFVLTPSGPVGLYEISPEEMKLLQKEPVSGQPSYICGEEIWPTPIQNWPIVDRPD